MSSKLSNNQVLINEIIIQEFEEQDRYSKMDDFFEFYAISQRLKAYDLGYDEIESGITGNGLDGGCDGIYLFLNGNLVVEDMDMTEVNKKDNKLELIIIQTKNSTKFKEDVMDKWKTVSKNLLELSNEAKDYSSRYNKEILKAFQIFKDTYIKLIRRKIKLEIKYIYMSKGIEIHPNVIAQAEELKVVVNDIFPNKNVSVDVEFVTADNLMELISFESDMDFSLKLKEKPINFDSKQDYITLIGLKDYYNFITNDDNELIRHIFESNVRDYQGKTNVNKEIEATLKNYDSGDFWWLNNGITILANEANLVTGKELLVSEPEIVNGLQTSTEIYKHFSNMQEVVDDNRSVLVRVIVPESEEERDNIILATNSQTSIPKASLRATDKIHRQIELYFKSRGLYYDRRKNYYKNQGKKPAHIVSIPFLSQCLMSTILQKPDYARARPSTLLAEDDTYKKLYSENYDLSAFYNLAKLSKEVERLLKMRVDYTSVEKGDILFYLIYFFVSVSSGKLAIDESSLSELDIEIITDDLIESYSDIIYEQYMSLGGNSKVAKGSELIKCIQSVLKEKFNVE